MYTAKDLRELFEKSDALKALKEVNARLTHEEFVQEMQKCLSHAYWKNRRKAVKYIVSFYPQNALSKLVKINLNDIFEAKTQEVYEKKVEMFKIISPKFNIKTYYDYLDFYSQQPSSDRELRAYRLSELKKILLENALPEITQDKINKPKI